MRNMVVGHALLLMLALHSTVAISQQNASVVGGVVTDASSGRSIRRARVTLISGGTNTLVYTSSDGKFSFPSVPPGQYKLTVVADGFLAAEYGQSAIGRPGKLLDVGPGRDLQDLSVKMTPASAVSGRLSDTYDAPLVNVEVQALKLSYREGQRILSIARTARTNDRGEYRVFWLQPGQYVICAAPTVRNDGDSVLVELGPNSPMRLADGTTGGTVRVGAGAAAALGLGAVAPTGEAYPTTCFPSVTITPPTILQLRPGEGFSGADFRMTETHTVNVRGLVLNTQTGQPERRVTVSLVPQTKPLGVAAPPRSTATNDQGTFEFRSVIPGAYFVSAMLNPSGFQVVGTGASVLVAPGLSTTNSQPQLTAQVEVQVRDTDTTTPNLVLRPGVVVSGTIAQQGGAQVPLTNLRVQLNDAAGAQLRAPVSALTKEGTFAVRDVVPGEYTVSVLGLPPNAYVKDVHFGTTDATDRTLPINAEPRVPIQILLATTTSGLDVLVSDDQQRPFPGAIVVAVPSDRRRFAAYRTGATDNFGRARLANMPPGNYKVFAWEQAEDGSWQAAEFLSLYEMKGEAVTIAEDTKANLNLRLIPAQ